MKQIKQEKRQDIIINSSMYDTRDIGVTWQAFEKTGTDLKHMLLILIKKHTHVKIR